MNSVPLNADLEGHIIIYVRMGETKEGFYIRPRGVNFGEIKVRLVVAIINNNRHVLPTFSVVPAAPALYRLFRKGVSH